MDRLISSKVVFIPATAQRSSLIPNIKVGFLHNPDLNISVQTFTPPTVYNLYLKCSLFVFGFVFFLIPMLNEMWVYFCN